VKIMATWSKMSDQLIRNRLSGGCNGDFLRILRIFGLGVDGAGIILGRLGKGSGKG